MRTATRVARKIGQKAVLNGRPVVWGGSDYGWQSQRSYQQLENQGQLALGGGLVRRIGQMMERAEQFRHQTFGTDQNLRNASNKLEQAYDQSIIGQAEQGLADLGGKGAQALGVTPALGALLVGTLLPGPGEAKAIDALGDATRAARAAQRTGRQVPNVTRGNVTGPAEIARTYHPESPTPARTLGPGELTIRQADQSIAVVTPRAPGTPPGQARRAARAQARDPQGTAKAQAAYEGSPNVQGPRTRQFDERVRGSDLRGDDSFPRSSAGVKSQASAKEGVWPSESHPGDPRQPGTNTVKRVEYDWSAPTPELTEKNLRLQRAQQRLRDSGRVQQANRRPTRQEQRNLDRYDASGENVVREYNDRGVPASQRVDDVQDINGRSDRSFTDNGGFDKFEAQDLGRDSDNINQGITYRNTDVTNEGTGRRGATGPVRTQFDVARARKDMEKAGINTAHIDNFAELSPKDQKAIRKQVRSFIRENYNEDKFGNRRPFTSGRGTTSSTLNDKVTAFFDEVRFPEQFNQLEAERRGARASRRGAQSGFVTDPSTGRRVRDANGNTIPHHPTWNDGNGKELITPGQASDRQVRTGETKTAKDAKRRDNISGGRRIPQTQLEQRRRNRSRTRIEAARASEGGRGRNDGGVNWNDRPTTTRRATDNPRNSDRISPAFDRSNDARVRQNVETLKHALVDPLSPEDALRSNKTAALRFNRDPAMDSRRYSSPTQRLDNEGRGRNRTNPRTEIEKPTDPTQTGGKIQDLPVTERRTGNRYTRLHGPRQRHEANLRGPRIRSDSRFPGPVSDTKEFGAGAERGHGASQVQRSSRRGNRVGRRMTEKEQKQWLRENIKETKGDSNNEFLPDGELRGVRGKGSSTRAGRTKPATKKAEKLLDKARERRARRRNR